MQMRHVLPLLAGVTLVMPVACTAPEGALYWDEAACAEQRLQWGTPEFAACLQRQQLQTPLMTLPPTAAPVPDQVSPR